MQTYKILSLKNTEEFILIHFTKTKQLIFKRIKINMEVYFWIIKFFTCIKCVLRKKSQKVIQRIKILFIFEQ
jgi:hypothetical protein